MITVLWDNKSLQKEVSTSKINKSSHEIQNDDEFIAEFGDLSKVIKYVLKF